MAATTTMFQETEVDISLEDQQKINEFARLNSNFEECKDNLKAKQNQLKNTEDALDELELTSEGEEKIPFLKGEVFVIQTLEETKKSLEETIADIKKQIKETDSKRVMLQEKMSNLKAVLYGKFGVNINLESD